MQETSEQYIQRMIGYVANRKPLAIQASTPSKIERLLKRAPAAKLKKRPAPEKWSVSEIVAHLADTEMVIGCRVRMILGQPGATLQPFDQDAWAAAMRYGKRDARKSFAQFRAFREANLALLKSLTPEQWKQSGVHPERGELTVEKITVMTAGHDVNHLGQIERILAPARK
ncbi:MAG TPA: DinB family protein [Candidatus Aquilonibacter sp.]|nr:DinB family protein [Candidatus Aquilonibacter sp.]